MSKRCSLWWCDKPFYANGYCKAHDTANKRFGTPYGKHAPQMSKINHEINTARLVAIRVTEFGEIERQSILNDVALHKYCPFCHSVGEHKPLCVVNLSKSLLEDTYRE
jgi:hypothetical protein